MKRDLDLVLDECLALLAQKRATVEECLARYPEQAAELRPLLESALVVLQLPHPASSPAAFAAGRERMLRAARLRSPAASRGGRPAQVLRGGPGPARPRRVVLHLALGTVLALLLCVISGLLLDFYPKPPVVHEMAVMEQVSGEIEVLIPGQSAWQPATAGMPLVEGTYLRAGPGSAAVLTFFDGSRGELGERTAVALVQGQVEGGRPAIALRQDYGWARYYVEHRPGELPRFEVQTPAARATAHGTEFTVAVADDGTTYVTVQEGRVEVQAQERTVEVPGGAETQVKKDQPPATAYPAPTATATPWPEPTSTPRPTRTPEPTVVPEPSETLEPPEETEQPGQTPEPTEEESPEPIQSPEPTESPHPPESPEPTQPAEPTHTFEPTHSPEPTETLGPTYSPEPTGTPGPTPTPTPSPTPTPA